jgi:hypothetical protein
MTDIAELHAQALDATGRIVGRVAADRWHAATRAQTEKRAPWSIISSRETSPEPPHNGVAGRGLAMSSGQLARSRSGGMAEENWDVWSESRYSRSDRRVTRSSRATSRAVGIFLSWWRPWRTATWSMRLRLLSAARGLGACTRPGSRKMSRPPRNLITRRQLTAVRHPSPRCPHHRRPDRQ